MRPHDTGIKNKQNMEHIRMLLQDKLCDAGPFLFAKRPRIVLSMPFHSDGSRIIPRPKCFRQRDTKADEHIRTQVHPRTDVR